MSGLSQVCPTLAFTVDGQQVVTDQQTDFRGVKCRDLTNGIRVKVRGFRQATGVVLATRIDRD